MQKRDIRLQNRKWYFVSDYDIKKGEKLFFKDLMFLIVSTLKIFRSQLVETIVMGKPRLAKSPKKFNFKIRSFKRILNLT